VNLLLEALENAEKKIDYYALDLSRTELARTLAQVPAYRHVRCRGLLGTYDDGREWLRKPENVVRRKCILSLGSSIGMEDRHLPAPQSRRLTSYQVTSIETMLRTSCGLLPMCCSMEIAC
jgi:uncharacterized SAM-dependent methyltransferase